MVDVSQDADLVCGQLLREFCVDEMRTYIAHIYGMPLQAS